jgi:biotin carboxyl carrier protein
VSDSSAPAKSPAVRSLGEGRYLVTTGDVSRLAYAVRSSAGTWVFIDGLVRLIADESDDAVRHGTDDQAALTAPMPATVVAINVATGQRVATGDMLILLEAMKMELPIKAPRDGTVSRVSCTVGELVQPGVLLVEFAD